MDAVLKQVQDVVDGQIVSQSSGTWLVWRGRLTRA